MEEKDQKIGENTSAGAEKVKTVEKKNSPAQKKATERSNAQKRTAHAKEAVKHKEQKKLSRAELKEKRKERRLAYKEKALERRAHRKENQEKRAAEKAARRDMLRNETALQRLERKKKEKEARLIERAKAHERRHELSLKRREEALQKRQARLQDRAHKREQRTARRHAPGFGGWLAAVISLGTASLAMATVITAGAMNIARLNGGMITGYMDNVYELDNAADNIQVSLGKLRVASSAEDQTRLLTEVLANGEIAECDLERLPVDSLTSSSITGFLGKTLDFARETLVKLSNGEKLDDNDYATISYLYETNTKIRSELDRLCTEMSAKDMMELLKGKMDGMLYKAFSSVSEGTLAVPETITQGPFAGKVYKLSAKALSSYEDISSVEGEDLVKKYLQGYSVSEVECTGEATVSGFTCYNYTATDDRGRDFFVQLSEKGGKLVLFDSFEECQANNYDLEKCTEIAQEFLSDCGFENLAPVFSFETGTTADINFCYEQDGVICYADMVKVKVCETRGIVTGVEAFPYWLNHTQREIGSPSLTVADAMEKADKIEVTSSRLCLTPVFGKETLCYELVGDYGGETYYVYLDAANGKEVAVYTLLNSDAGKIIS